jgi:hypothetical protein
MTPKNPLAVHRAHADRQAKNITLPVPEGPHTLLIDGTWGSTNAQPLPTIIDVSILCDGRKDLRVTRSGHLKLPAGTRQVRLEVVKANPAVDLEVSIVPTAATTKAPK